MRCLHPHCPLPGPNHPADWPAAIAALQQEGVFLRQADITRFQQLVPNLGPLVAGANPAPVAWNGTPATWERLREACPCLCTQIDNDLSANAIVHLCETTIGSIVTEANVEAGFTAQHPAQFTYPPLRAYGNAGAVSQAFCRAVLLAAGLQ